jgi:hypothetical protein
VYGPCLLAWRGEAKARDCIFAISQTGSSSAHHDEVMWFFSSCTSCLLLSMDVWCRSSDVCKWVGGDPLLLWDSGCHQSPYGNQFSFVARKTTRIFLIMFLWSFLNYKQEFFAKSWTWQHAKEHSITLESFRAGGKLAMLFFVILEVCAFSEGS